MTFSLVIYLFVGVTASGSPVFEPDVPIIVRRNMTETNCSIGLEVIEDTRIVDVNGVAFVFDPNLMVAFCEPEA